MIFEDETLGGRLSRAALHIEAKKFFKSDYIDNKEGRAAEAAYKLIDHLTGRAWILHEVGEGIFEFTHRTFLEFFYACYLEAKYETTDELLRHILKYITGGQRVLSSHLALQNRVKNKRAAATIVSDTITKNINDRKANINEILPFSAAMFEYLLPDANSVSKLSDAISISAIDNAIYEPLALLLRTRSPLRAVILAPAIRRLADIDRISDIRAMQKVFETLFDKSNDSELSKAIDKYLVPSLEKKQGKSPFIVKLLIDLEREPDWNAVWRFGFRLWRPNDRRIGGPDFRGGDGEDIIKLALAKPSSVIIPGKDILIYLASELWKRSENYAGMTDIVRSNSRSWLYMPNIFGVTQSAIEALTTERLHAFVFGFIMYCEYFEYIKELVYLDMDIDHLVLEIGRRGDFINRQLFDTWLSGNISLFSKNKHVGNRRNRIDDALQRFKSTNTSEIDDDNLQDEEYLYF